MRLHYGSATASALAAPNSRSPVELRHRMLNLPGAWSTSTNAVTVAAVDSGVDDEPFLAPRLVPGHDFADGTGSTKDGEGHGTHVAGSWRRWRRRPNHAGRRLARGSTKTFAAGPVAGHYGAAHQPIRRSSGILAQIERRAR
jgi:hypothetical protein